MHSMILLKYHPTRLLGASNASKPVVGLFSKPSTDTSLGKAKRSDINGSIVGRFRLNLLLLRESVTLPLAVYSPVSSV